MRSREPYDSHEMPATEFNRLRALDRHNPHDFEIPSLIDASKLPPVPEHTPEQRAAEDLRVSTFPLQGTCPQINVEFQFYGSGKTTATCYTMEAAEAMVKAFNGKIV